MRVFSYILYTYVLHVLHSIILIFLHIIWHIELQIKFYSGTNSDKMSLRQLKERNIV